MEFDGETFEADHDEARLSAQLERVRALMADGAWRTLSEIAAATGDGSDAGISARLRDLRKPRFGAYVVERRPRGDRGRGVFEYRVGRSAIPIASTEETTRRKPTRVEMRRALEELRGLVRGRQVSPELVKLGRWIARQCEGP